MTDPAKKAFTVPLALDGQRVDRALVTLWAGVSRAEVKRAMERDAVRVNGRRVAKGASLVQGDIIEVVPERFRLGAVVATANPALPLRVVLETSELIVVDKPARMPTAPLSSDETETLANAVLARYPELQGIGYGPSEPGLVHRLDTDTSGLVLLARTRESFELLKGLLRSSEIRKEYLALCTSDGLPDRGTIGIPLANHPKDRRRVLACTHPRDVARLSPKAAATDFEVLGRRGSLALVRVLAPRAMRHQIRAHFAAIEHPLIGDVLYGAPADSGLDRHALHAARIQYRGGSIPAFDAASDLPSELAVRFAAEPTNDMPRHDAAEP